MKFSNWAPKFLAPALIGYATFRSGRFGVAISVRGHFGHDISVHKQLITFVEMII